MTTRVFTSVLQPGGVGMVTPAIMTAHYQELHSELLAAGLVQTTDIGQIDFDTFVPPSITSVAAWYGYKVYQLNDGLSPNVYIKVRFGLSGGANSAGRSSRRLGVSMGFATDGAGNIIGGTTERTQISGSTYFNYRSDYATYESSSYICVSSGFFGLIYKTFAITPNNSYGPSATNADAPCLAAFFVCRTTDDAGQYTEDGATIVFAGDSRAYNYYGGPAIVTHLTAGGEQIETARGGLALGADYVTAIGGNLPIYSMYAMTPTPKRIMQLGIVTRVPGSAKDEVSIALKGTTPRNYLVHHGCWPADAIGGTGTRSCIAMLWE